MDKNDIVRLKVWKSKEGLLDNRCFGEICFGNGSPPLPNLIAHGDLDGDLYFVLWDKSMVESVPMTDIKKLERTVGLSQKRKRDSRRRAAIRAGENADSNGNWFDLMQDAIVDVALSVRISKLIGILYNEAKAELESSDCVYEDYVAYGKAFKKALDLNKHGDAIELPEHLWEPVPENLREFLVLPYI
jgi:hypothetical protein